MYFILICDCSRATSALRYELKVSSVLDCMVLPYPLMLEAIEAKYLVKFNFTDSDQTIEIDIYSIVLFASRQLLCIVSILSHSLALSTFNLYISNSITFKRNNERIDYLLERSNCNVVDKRVSYDFILR